MHSIEDYQNIFADYLRDFSTTKQPQRLYTPIEYLLNLGGKRLRPVLTLTSTALFGGDYKTALSAALSIEVFHNFTLMHDDIMDAAPLRRSHKTVHKKWNLNTAILSGDAMLIMAYQLLESYPPKVFKALFEVFSTTALQVCEGQQYDMDFETSQTVSESDYLQMITNKTAVLLGAAMQMGAIIAQASETACQTIYNFGKNLGIAFQLQDDYLDTFGTSETFGKQIGGDIIENKKTYLYLKTLALSSETTQQNLKALYNTPSENHKHKIAEVSKLFVLSGAKDATQEAISHYTEKALSSLKTLDISKEKKQILEDFANKLMHRTV